MLWVLRDELVFLPTTAIHFLLSLRLQCPICRSSGTSLSAVHQRDQREGETWSKSPRQSIFYHLSQLESAQERWKERLIETESRGGGTDFKEHAPPQFKSPWGKSDICPNVHLRNHIAWLSTECKPSKPTSSCTRGWSSECTSRAQQCTADKTAPALRHTSMCIPFRPMIANDAEAECWFALCVNSLTGLGDAEYVGIERDGRWFSHCPAPFLLQICCLTWCCMHYMQAWPFADGKEASSTGLWVKQ